MSPVISQKLVPSCTMAWRDGSFSRPTIQVNRDCCGAAEYQPVEFSLTNVLPVLPNAP
ncbi:hypothetical protein H6F50_03660 [Coleofasciculus sp. FACHB-712]|nr:hypothetical protein [Coleofasciculus sp. FACHB-712]